MQPQLSDPDWLAKCDSIIGRELSRRGWTLADDPAMFGPGQSFTANVLARITEWVTQETRPFDDKLISDAVKNEYSRLLEIAIGRDGSRVQNTALSEAMRYAWPHALQRCSSLEQAETAILRAATQAWLHIDRCYPGCFLAWFTSIVIHETANLDKQERRLAGRETSAIDLPADPSHGPDSDSSPLDAAVRLSGYSVPSADIAAVQRVLARTALIDMLSACLENARREFILIAEFFLELNASEIAHHLAVKVGVIYTEKNRALERIRERCREFITELQLMLSS